MAKSKFPLYKILSPKRKTVSIIIDGPTKRRIHRATPLKNKDIDTNRKSAINGKKEER